MGLKTTLGVALIALIWSSMGLAQDASDGEMLFNRVCAACHSAEAGKNKLGPSLFGIIGRKAGTAAGFKYSDAMQMFGKTWDEAALDTYLTDPKGTVPGTKMTYVGVPSPADREGLIAYLKTLH